MITKTLGDLHDHLKSLGYTFESLRKTEELITVFWGKSLPDISIQTNIDAFVWEEAEPETLESRIAKLETDVAALGA